MRFWRSRTPQHVIDGAKQAQLNYRIHLVELALLPIDAEDVFDDEGNPIEWTREEMNKNAMELTRVNAELVKFT